MKKWKKILLGFAYFLIINVLLLLLFDVWKFKTSTVLFSDDTLNGHNVQLIQKGHQFLTGQHSILITVDGKDICILILGPPSYTKASESLYDSQYISCETDNESSYKIVFNSGYYFIEFDADFTQVKCVCAWEYKHLSKEVELVEFQRQD